MAHPFLQAFGFLLGGYETTASSLGFTIYNLSANPDKAAKLAQVSVNGYAIPGHKGQSMPAFAACHFSMHPPCAVARAPDAPLHGGAAVMDMDQQQPL